MTNCKNLREKKRNLQTSHIIESWDIFEQEYFFFISFHFHFIIFTQGKYSSHTNIHLQTALLQKKS